MEAQEQPPAGNHPPGAEVPLEVPPSTQPTIGNPDVATTILTLASTIQTTQDQLNSFQAVVPLSFELVFPTTLPSAIPLGGAPSATVSGLQNLASLSAPSTSNNPSNPNPFQGSTPVASAPQPPAFSFTPPPTQPSYKVLTLQ